MSTLKKVLSLALVTIVVTVVLLDYGADHVALGASPEPQVLIFTDIADCEEPREPVGITALENLGIPYEHYSGEEEYDEFITALEGLGPDGLAIIEAPCYRGYDWEALITWVGSGGKLISSLWEPPEDFFYAMGAERAEDLDEPMEVYAWEPYPLFTRPNEVPSPLVPRSETPWGDNGDMMEPLEGAIAYAGFTTSSRPGAAATILGNDGRTLINGFLFDDFLGVDEDGDGKDDIVEYVENQIQFLLIPPCPAPLAPGAAVSGSVGPLGFQPQPPKEYCVEVAPGTAILAIGLQSVTGGNLDLHVRYGKPPERAGGQVVADYSLVSPHGDEFFLLHDPRPGTYYIAVENREDAEESYTLVPLPFPAFYEGDYPVEGSVAPPPIAELAAYLQTERGQLSLWQYKVVVPKGAKRLTIELEGLDGKNADLHIRYGKPVEIKDGKVVADLSSISLAGEEAVVISGDFLKSGTYYIAIEGLEPPQEFTITVTIDCGEGQQTATLIPFEVI